MAAHSRAQVTAANKFNLKQDIMKKIELKKIKFGGLVRLSCSEDAPVWIRDEYDRREGRYICYKWDDVNYWTYMRSARGVYAV